METIGVRELKNGASEILRKVEAGERFIITNHGREVAELGRRQDSYWRSWPEVADVFDSHVDPDFMDDLAALGPVSLADPWVARS